jgi:hypothetical protein
MWFAHIKSALKALERVRIQMATRFDTRDDSQLIDHQGIFEFEIRITNVKGTSAIGRSGKPQMTLLNFSVMVVEIVDFVDFQGSRLKLPSPTNRGCLYNPELK